MFEHMISSSGSVENNDSSCDVNYVAVFVTSNKSYNVFINYNVSFIFLIRYYKLVALNEGRVFLTRTGYGPSDVRCSQKFII